MSEIKIGLFDASKCLKDAINGVPEEGMHTIDHILEHPEYYGSREKLLLESEVGMLVKKLHEETDKPVSTNAFRINEYIKDSNTVIFLSEKKETWPFSLNRWTWLALLLNNKGIMQKIGIGETEQRVNKNGKPAIIHPSGFYDELASLPTDRLIAARNYIQSLCNIS